MRFGSVEFFKVLIKTVLAIVFFVPLVLAIVFGVLNAKKSESLDEAKRENARLAAVADVLVEEKIGEIEDFCLIFEKSGISYQDLINELNSEKKLDAAGFYEILSAAGVSDKDIIALAAAKNAVGAADFLEIMTDCGITDADLLEIMANKKGGGIEGYCKVLEECGITPEELMSYYGAVTVNPSDNSRAEDNTSVPQPIEDSAYSDLYEDMYVQAPDDFVYEAGTIYLTFDDGPSQYTPSILNYLDEFGIKATFFVVPNRSEECYATLKEIVDRGHSIGVHSASHDYEQIYASVEAFLDDFHEAWDIIREATGVSTQIFRFPGGSKNDFDEDVCDDIIAEMTRRGFRYFDWNVESGDVADATWTEMYNSVPSDIKNVERAVVLFHDTRYNTVLVLEDILKVLTNEGYKFDKINNDTEPVQFIGPFS